MNNLLGNKITFSSLIKFVFPTMVMMVFMSLYSMVDGIFISRYIGTDALSAANIVFPIISITIAVGIMLGTGGSAIVAKKMGEGKDIEAKENFTLIVLAGILMGFFLSFIGIIFLNPIIKMLGANDAIYKYCYDYALPLVCFIPLSILQMLFQTFFVTSGKPQIGLVVTILGGVTNIVLDYLFIAVFNMGISGAAIATIIGYSIPAVYGLIYFTFSKKSLLKFVKPKFDLKVLLQSCGNGSSEMVTNLSTAVTTFLFNIVMMRYLGADGVASMTIVLYVQYFLTAVYLGYSTGVAPIISYNYGNNSNEQLKKIFSISVIFLAVSSIVTFVFAMVFTEQIVLVFAAKTSPVFKITVEGLYLFSISFLFTGTNIFASSLFTAFSDGKVSAILSFLRTFVFIAISVTILPQMIGINGVWLAIPIAEALGILVSLFYLYKKRFVYHYA